MNVPLNIDWQQILLHLFNFIILAGGLYFLLYKPVKKFMDQRTAYYRDLDAQANEKLENAKKLENEYAAKLDAAADEIRAQKAGAMKDAETAAAATLDAAKKQKAQILADAAAAAACEKEQIVEDAKAEIADLAVAAAKKLIDAQTGAGTGAEARHE